MLTKKVHNAINSNNTLLFFLLLFDKYNLWFNNKEINWIHLTVECVYINDVFISVSKKSNDPVWNQEESQSFPSRNAEGALYSYAPDLVIGSSVVCVKWPKSVNLIGCNIVNVNISK